MKRLTANQFNDDWALVTAGTKDHFNTMTVSWGGMGTLWGKPVVTIYIRPNRYTYEFIENNDTFTVSFFDEDYKKDLGYLGSHSGRDENKLEKTSLTPEILDNGITFKQARMTLVCKKIYFQDMELDRIPSVARDRFFKEEPVHRMYIGEVMEIIED